MVNLSNLVGFALTLTARCKESRVELEGSFSTAQRQADFHADESPGFQIEHQINWKVDASSRGIQSKTHLKSKC